MGEIHSDVALENTFDRGMVEGGHRNEADIRHAIVDGTTAPPPRVNRVAMRRLRYGS